MRKLAPVVWMRGRCSCSSGCTAVAWFLRICGTSLGQRRARAELGGCNLQGYIEQQCLTWCELDGASFDRGIRVLETHVMAACAERDWSRKGCDFHLLPVHDHVRPGVRNHAQRGASGW